MLGGEACQKNGDGDVRATGLGGMVYERADCEKVFDELKNQWGLAGLTTRDLARCRIMARIVAWVCNWRNVFARLADPSEHMEALTSHPVLPQVIAQVVTHADRKVLRLRSHNGLVREVREACVRFDTIFRRLPAIAERLKRIGKWRFLLMPTWVYPRSAHFSCAGGDVLAHLRRLRPRRTAAKKTQGDDSSPLCREDRRTHRLSRQPRRNHRMKTRVPPSGYSL